MMQKTFATLALSACLAACSQSAPDTATNAASNEAAATPANIAVNEAAPAPAAPVAEPKADAKVLTLEGLGLLKIGQAPPVGWGERGAQVSDACRTVTSPDFPGVTAIVEGGKVRRISVGQRSTVKLIEGIGAGATEAEVRGAFPGFRSEPHKYEAAPAKYLTAPNAPTGDSALRFEIDAKGKVSQMHIGTMPALAYVEGCA